MRIFAAKTVFISRKLNKIYKFIIGMKMAKGLFCAEQKN